MSSSPVVAEVVANAVAEENVHISFLGRAERFSADDEIPCVYAVAKSADALQTGAAQPKEVAAAASNAAAMDKPEPYIPSPAVANAAIHSKKLTHLKMRIAILPLNSPCDGIH